MTRFSACILLAACGGSTTSYSGHSTYEYLPLDGERSWSYVSADEAEERRLEVEKVESSREDGIEVVVLEYSWFDPAETLASISWSSDAIKGIQIHGYGLSGDVGTDFETPVQVAEYKMLPGEELTTATDGLEFLSIFHGVEDCPNEWIRDDQDAWECLHFTVSEAGGGSGIPFIGEWWVANTWGASRFIAEEGPFSNANAWVLSGAEWTGE